MFDHGLADFSVCRPGYVHIKVPCYQRGGCEVAALEGMEEVDPTPFVRVARLAFHLIVLRIVCYVRRSNVKGIHSEKNEFYEIRYTMSKLTET